MAALLTANEWRCRDTVWTDGSRIDNGEVAGGSVMHLAAASGWTGCRYRLGTNKEIFDAETFAIYQALRILDRHQESGLRYTVFVDSTTAIDRVRIDALGPGQRFAIAKMEVCGRVLAQGNKVTIRWIPAHSKVVGKEKVDELAKAAARRSASCSDEAVLDELAGNYYQFLSGHAAVGAYLKDKTEKSYLYRCWWCDTAER